MLERQELAMHGVCCDDQATGELRALLSGASQRQPYDARHRLTAAQAASADTPFGPEPHFAAYTFRSHHSNSSLGLRRHEKLWARDAATPHERHNEEKRQKRAGDGPEHADIRIAEITACRAGRLRREGHREPHRPPKPALVAGSGAAMFARIRLTVLSSDRALAWSAE